VTNVSVGPAGQVRLSNTDGPLILYDDYGLTGSVASIQGYVADVKSRISGRSCSTSVPATLYNLPNVHRVDRSRADLKICPVSKGSRDSLPFVPESADVP
jgi:hypothetical protein